MNEEQEKIVRDHVERALFARFRESVPRNVVGACFDPKLCRGAVDTVVEIVRTAALDGDYDPKPQMQRILDRLGRIEKRLEQDSACTMSAGRWWRVCAPDGSVWCETSDEKEAVERMRPGDSLFRQYAGHHSEWRPANLCATGGSPTQGRHP